MTPLTTSITTLFSLLTILGQVFVIILLLLFIFSRDRVIAFFQKRGLLFSFVIVLFGTLGSLFYSEIAGFTPCELCWFQRIFMYPQVFLLGIALFKKDLRIFIYSLPLSIIGGAIALYHYLLQLEVVPSLPCSAIGVSVSCSQRFVMSFGYITLPMMALTAFLLLILFAFFAKAQSRKDI